MERIWIIGAGTFGLRASKWLNRQEERPFDITMVDLDRESLAEAKALGCRTQQEDAVKFLSTRLTRENGPDWVVPAVPVHLAFEWCRQRLGGEMMLPEPLPDGIEDCLPNPMRGQGSDIYVSHAEFLCPPNCNEPDDRCTKTGDPRKTDMFKLLARVSFQDTTPFILQSIQLGPGVGGYTPAAMFDLLDRLKNHRGRCLVATACRCHGVLSGAVVS
ncbi:MAG TPA: potassium transporter [Desulfobacteraceae bacterium]|nr:potassium transporter [Desulfobacteraceae bacterium]|tara:strand:- start:912 stop:1559 length:648 start_codon:yes stop_codon:yes gene_type:complete